MTSTRRSLRINTTRPTFGAGGGVLLDAGPVSIDIGYRYKRIAPGDTIIGTLNDGKDYHREPGARRRRRALLTIRTPVAIPIPDPRSPILALR